MSSVIIQLIFTQPHLPPQEIIFEGINPKTSNMNKFVCLLAIVSMANAGAIAVGGPIGLAQTFSQSILQAQAAAPLALATPAISAVRTEPYDPNPQYQYGYSVSDALTGDSKTATETRNGDLVQGQYSLVEPDGAIRTVTYTADAINGFNAVVDRQAPATVVTKTLAAPLTLATQPLATKAILG